MPIQAGKAISNTDLGFQGDDTGDNISIKNPGYAELTVQYWAWKNLKNVDYIGLNHYRRYFLFSSLPFQTKKIRSSVKEFLTVKNTTFDVHKHLGKCDIILAKRAIFPYPVYMTASDMDDYRLFKKTVYNSFPEYYYSFCDVMEHRNRMSHGNLFITKWEIFEDYCKWIFDIFGKVEKLKDFSGYSVEKARVFGFMAEFLLNVYVAKNKLKVKYYPILELRDNYQIDSAREVLNSFKYTLSFAISRSWSWWLKNKVLRNK
jgi:hypothetical protein